MWYRHDAVVRAAWVALLVAGAVPVVAVAVIASAVYLAPGFTALPPPPGPPAGQVSVVYDAAGRVIARFHDHDRFVPVTAEELPRHLLEATVAAEDRSFYAHAGIDLRGVVRALVADVRAGRLEQGGSTITQQYVKNAFTGAQRTLGRKLREAVLARRLEQSLGKDEILRRYLSTAYFGNGAHGVGAASSVYFGKEVRDLTVSESALLVGMLPAPSRYDPRRFPKEAERRRVTVLDAMRDIGYLDADEHARAVSARLWTSAEPPPPAVTVVRPPDAGLERHPYFVDYLRRYLEARVGAVALRRGGLEIHTTLDRATQRAAERAVAGAVGNLPPPIDMALAAVEPATGYVRALVGGRDFGAPGGQVNLALGHCPERHPGAAVPAQCWEHDVVVDGGGTGRQPGSAWKPFVLAAAIERGIRPSSAYRAPRSFRVPGCAGRGCVIRNFDGRAYGRLSVAAATVRSVNTVFAQLVDDVGVPAVARMASRLGVTTAWADASRHGLSYALGVQEVAPLEMAGAYAVFAAEGLRAAPTPVRFVRGPAGTMLEDNRKRPPERVLPRSLAAAVTRVLGDVVERGTGRRAAIDGPAAGKTGTTQAFRDAWFVGYTPHLSAAVWMGNRDRAAPMTDVGGVDAVTGGSIPAEAWARFMSAAPPARRPPAAGTAPMHSAHARSTSAGAAPTPATAFGPPPTAPTTGTAATTTTTTMTNPVTVTTTAPSVPPGIRTRTASTTTTTTAARNPAAPTLIDRLLP